MITVEKIKNLLNEKPSITDLEIQEYIFESLVAKPNALNIHNPFASEVGQEFVKDYMDKLAKTCPVKRKDSGESSLH